MKCANPACGGELFKVRVLPKEENLTVELTCAKCGKVVKAWMTNEQLKVLNRQMLAVNSQIGRLADIVEKENKKPWWRR